ncbi:MAG: S9 family peptidase [Pseudomarimonas sp.]
MIRIAVLSALAGMLGACAPSEAPAPAATPAAPAVATPPPEPALISRKVIFDNPERAAGQISPDGKWLGFIAPRDGVLNVWVAPTATPDDAKPITNDRVRGIRGFSFAFTGNHVLYAQDDGGDENFQVFAVDLTSGENKPLTPKGPRAEIAGVSRDVPGKVLISINDREPKFFDLVEVDIASGKLNRLVENEGYEAFVTDDSFALRYATKPRADGGYDWFVRDGKNWKAWTTVDPADALTTQMAGFTRDGKTLYLLDSRERNTGALFALDTASGEKTLVHADERADTGSVLQDPATGKIQAVNVNYLKAAWTVLDPAIAGDMEKLQTTLGEGEINITSRTDDDRRWTVLHTRSDASAKYHLYDRDSGAITPWFDTRPALAKETLSSMQALELKSRDGLTLVSYLTLPPASDADKDGRPEKPVPMVLLVHGGPWARDQYGLNGTHQWLANRGYAALSVNFRGSTGFGKSFTNAGDKQWGRTMHDDLIDAVEWAVSNNIAPREKVAIMGGSYGGYATLAGLTMTPTTFACGVDIVGPSNLNTLLGSIPPYWESFKRVFANRVGDPETEEGRALLTERSPLTYVDQIARPLLIGQGANDPRVKQAESDQIVAAMTAKKIPVTYALYPDEGHGFARPPNRLSFNAVTEGFLSTCLGGRVEAIGSDLEGSTLQVPVGAELVPGLSDALAAAAKPAATEAPAEDKAPTPAAGS